MGETYNLPSIPPVSPRARIAVIVGTKGRGSNMLALVKAGRSGAMAGEVVLVFGANVDAPALAAAANEGVSTLAFSDKESDFPHRLLRTLQEARIDLVCLGGYLRLLPSLVLDAFPQRVLNIHPALLPKFGGKGMYGHHVHEAVLAAKETESGCTVHYVTPVYDEGDIILQRRCPVLPGDTPDTLSARVLAEEHQAYPEAVNLVWAKLCP